jgi:GTP-binding protein EngB required for normal cell division
MRLSGPARLLLALGVVLGILAVAAAAVSFAGSLAQVWESLRTGPISIFAGLVIFLVVFIGLGGWVVWRVLFPGRRRQAKPRSAPDAESVTRRIEEGRDHGLDVSAAERELAELARRRAGGELYLCFFGEISAGKSTLVRALAGDAGIETGVEGGTTRTVEHYRWRTEGGDEVVLADVPGSGLENRHDELAVEEAIRAHVVVYVCDGDLTRAQFDDLSALVAVGKPLLLVFNKTDLYTAEEAALVARRLGDRLVDAGAGEDAEVVTLSVEALAETGAGGAARRSAGGEGLDRLRAALQRRIDHSPEALDALRDRAVFRMLSERLETAEQARRAQEAEEIVRGYTRKAIVGALAAVSPGTDILIQGYLGSALVRELCGLYDVPARDVEISRLLDLSQGYVGKTLPITLAVAGNALKAFPGVGTIAGGATHAVAYGLIFDALGRGLSRSLAEGGELRPAAAARRFRESMSEDLGARTIRLARMALEEGKERSGD